jgi:hypothetical protein
MGFTLYARRIVRVQNCLEDDVDRGTSRRSPGGTIQGTIAAANVAAALASGGLAAAAMVKPGLLLPDGDEATPAAAFLARYVAARSLPLSATVVALALLRSTNWFGACLVLAGLVQAADAVIGAGSRRRIQTLAPAAAATLHLASAWSLLRGRPHPWRD